MSRDTVRKYATMEDCSPKPAVRKGRRSLIDAYSGTVDSWLSADRLMPRKQRHTARRVYARLVEEEGFEGSYSSVQRYVKRWREEHRSDGDGYLELDWSAGVMQVDLGEAVATIGGGDVKVHCLVATFPHSNMRYVAAMPGENAECVCEGLAQIFDHIGMVPRVLVLDNATGAGHRVAWNKVIVVRVFAMFCDHYRLETRFCNPYSGNEKGFVENAVGFLRRSLMVPKPNAESHRQLTRHLLSRCDAIADSDHYRSGRPIRELFDEERGEMQPLPRARFDAVEWVERKADKEGNIQIGSVRYLAGPSWRGWTLLAGLRAFEVEIRTADGRHVNTLPPLLRERRTDGQEPRYAAARAGQETQHVGRVAPARRASGRARAASRRVGPRIETTRADAPAQGQPGERLRERGPGHDGDRGGRQDPGRGQPARPGQTDRAGRPARRGRRGRQARRIRRVQQPRRERRRIMTKASRTMADTRRRRASTGRMMDEIMELARSLPLTRQVLADSLEAATPAQMEFMLSWMNEELASRERSKRARLPKQAGLPGVKELDGYDWTPVRFPADYGREALESLDFVANSEDVVLFGPPGTGKTHLAVALARKACVEGVPARFFTAAGLVMRLLRASAEGRLDRELSAISKARLLVIDELGYVPVDEEGSRLLFQVVTNAYERQSVVYTTNIEFSGWGRVFGDPNTATAIVDRTVHHGRMIRFEGESYRRTHALMG